MLRKRKPYDVVMTSPEWAELQVTNARGEHQHINIPAALAGDIADALQQIWLEYHSADLCDEASAEPTLAALRDDASRSNHAFINRVRSLYNIDRYLLPELRDEDWPEFRDNPPRYLINRADKPQSDAIMREVEARQKP